MKTGDELMDKLRKLARTMLGGRRKAEKLDPAAPHMLVFGDGQALLLGETGLRAYDDIRRRLMDEKWIAQNYRAREVEKVVRGVVVQHAAARSDKGAAQGLAADLVGVLEEPLEICKTVVPIDGLVMRLPELRVGPARLFPATDEWVRRALKGVERAMPSRPSLTHEAKKTFADFCEEMLKTFVAGRVCMELEVSALPRRNLVVAVDAADNALNPLRAHLHVTCKKRADRTQRLAIAFDRTPKRGVFGWAADGWPLLSWQLVGGGPPLVIDEHWLRSMRELAAFDEVSDVLARAADGDACPTPVEERVATAIHWLGRGIGEESDAEALVMYAIAVEAALSDQDYPVRAEIAERAALLYGDPAGREREYRRVKRMYDVRSEIVHGRRKEATPSQAQEWEDLAFRVTVELARRAQSIGDAKLGEWFRALKFGA